MAFLHRVLEPPSYGWTEADGTLKIPSQQELIREFLARLDVSSDRRNWLALMSWAGTLGLLPFFVVFLHQTVTAWSAGTTAVLSAVGFAYGMVFMGTFGTIWYHRYGTHKAYTFGHPLWRFLTRNLAIKAVPEEIYIISHHVHHAMVEQPGDPYNAHAGGLYCFLADANHQLVSRSLSPEDYSRAVAMLQHTGLRMHSYEEYQRWGSITSPSETILTYVMNWSFWFAAFALLGGLPLAVAIFAGAFVWAVGIRTYNYSGHGSGKDSRVEGWDFNQRDLSINQYWAGFVAGEWHNNHHLYPSGARSGFLPGQLDLAWCYIKLLHLIGGVRSYRDYKAEFYEKYYLPYRARLHQEPHRETSS